MCDEFKMLSSSRRASGRICSCAAGIFPSASAGQLRGVTLASRTSTWNRRRDDLSLWRNKWEDTRGYAQAAAIKSSSHGFDMEEPAESPSESVSEQRQVKEVEWSPKGLAGYPAKGKVKVKTGTAASFSRDGELPEAHAASASFKTSKSTFRTNKTNKPFEDWTPRERRSYRLRKLNNALLVANEPEIEHHYYAFVEAHKECTDVGGSAVPAPLHLSITQLNRMLSVWSSAVALPHIGRETSAQDFDPESEREEGLERPLERGAKRAFERCMALLEQIESSLKVKLPVQQDPLRIIEKSQGLLRELLLQPHSAPRPQEAASHPQELLLEKLLRVTLQHSRAASGANLRDALKIIRYALPGWKKSKYLSLRGQTRREKRKSKAEGPDWAVADMDALASDLVESRNASHRQLTAGVYHIMLDAVALTTPRPVSLDASTPAEQEWRIHALREMLSSSPWKDTGPGSDKDSFDVLEDLLADWVPQSWSIEKALAGISGLWKDLMRKGEKPSSAAYATLIIFALRSRTIGGIPIIVEAAVRDGQADTFFFNTILANLSSVRPKTRDGPFWRAAFRSTQHQKGKFTALDDPREEASLVVAIYEAMRDNLITAERQDLQDLRSRDVSTRPRTRYSDYDDPLAALAATHEPDVSFARSAPAAPRRRTPAQQQLHRILGIDALPFDVIPNARTYAQTVKALSWHGGLNAAISVMEDMISTPLDAGRHLKRMTLEQRSEDEFFTSQKDSNSKQMGAETTFLPTIDIYDSLFRAFARHSVPARIEFLNEVVPSASRWTAEQDDAEDLESPWNVKSFCEVLEAFLKVLPRMRPKRKGWIDPYQDASARPSSIASQSQRPTAAPRRDTWEMSEMSVAPSPDQFFWLLTAMRRVSGDHARWVLLQWERVWRKFSPVDWLALAEDQASRRQERVANALVARQGRRGGEQVQRRLTRLKEKEKDDVRRKKVRSLDRAAAVHRGYRDEREPWTMALLNNRLIRVLMYLRDQSYK